MKNNEKYILPFSSVLGAVMLGFGVADAADKPEKRPNIVMIYVDDMDFSMLGCYGGYTETPNIDSLAMNGMKFTRYYTCCPVSQPSRYSLLTGKYASRNESANFKRDATKSNEAFIRWNTDMVDQDVTIAEILGKAGYQTGFVGKWHLGFPGYDPFAIPGDADPADPEIKKYLKDNYDKTLAHVKNVSGFNVVDRLYSINIRWIPVPDIMDFHNQDWITEGGLNFIENQSEKPFFLYFATSLPHYPSAVESLKHQPCNPEEGYTSERKCQPSRKSILKAVDKRREEGLTEMQLDHCAAMKWIDDAVGALVAELEKKGFADNTIIVFASDNDTRSKMACYDGRIPMIIKWPSHVAPGIVCDELVSNIDLAPTFYEIANADASDAVLDGTSLLPLLENGTCNRWRDHLYMEILYSRGIITKTRNYVAVRYPKEVMDKITLENRKKYNQEGTKISQNDGVTQEELVGEHVRYGTNVLFPAYYDFDQLYDLVEDPKEQHNLAYDKKYELELLRMKELLSRYCHKFDYSFGEFKR